jgi:hypothetical protein
MKNFVRIALALSTTLGGLDAAQARPVIIEESAVLTPPPGITYVRFGQQVGTNGEYALVTAERPTSGEDNEIYPFDALLYRRVNGNWVFQRILAQGSRDLSEDWSYFPVVIGMKGNLASAALGEETSSTTFRFNGTDWLPAGAGAGLQEDVSIDGDRILYGVGDSWNGRVYEPNGIGGWTSTWLPGQLRCCDDEFWGGPVDLLGDRAILATPDTYDLEPQEVPIYQRYPESGWQLMTKLQVPAGVFGLGGEVALHGDNAIVTGRSGPYVWNSSNYFYEPTGRVQAVNAYARNAITYKFAKEGNLLLAVAFDPDLGINVINVFRPDASGQYEHVAILKPKGGAGLNGSLEIDGNTVVAGSTMRALSFELPGSLTAAQPRYENFESGNGANWTPAAGSQFTVVRPTTIDGVYRQSSVLGDAHSVLGNTTWVQQGVEADIRPTAFDGNDRWVGLATRFVDMQNHYYVTLRSSGSVQLRRMRGGAFTTLATAPLPVQLNRTYRVRLDSIGNSHRVYVDGKLLLSAEDTGTPVAGNAALIMYKASADYDNVAVSPTPRGTIFTDDFTDPTTYQGDWTHNGPGQWSHARGAFVQNSVAAEARALIGTSTADQNVSLRVRPTAFATGSANQERWVGVIARYRNEQNYYYLTLRSGNALSLRKLVNGSITTIASVPVTVSVGSWYALRLEVAGTTLRAYLNGALVMQATDTTHASGRVGLMTYKAAAEFDDYVAYQP